MSLIGQSCPHCGDGTLANPPFSEAVNLGWEAIQNPLAEIGKVIKANYLNFTGKKRSLCYKCKSCSGYAIECPKCSAKLQISGTPRELQGLSCSVCDQEFYVTR